MTQTHRLSAHRRFPQNRYLLALGVSVVACLGAPDDPDLAADDPPEQPSSENGAGAQQAESTGGVHAPRPPRSEPLPIGSSCSAQNQAEGGNASTQDPDPPRGGSGGTASDPSSGGQSANAGMPAAGPGGTFSGGGGSPGQGGVPNQGAAGTGISGTSGTGSGFAGEGGSFAGEGGMGGALGEAGAAGSPGAGGFGGDGAVGGTSGDSGGSAGAGGSDGACGGMGGAPPEPEAGAGAGGAGGAGDPPVPEASLWISEYMEGASSDKALEIYNAGPDAVELGQCVVRWYANGATSPRTVALGEAMLPPGEVFVVCHSKASPDVLSRCDHPTGALGFNGDDAVALACFGENVDVIGQIGVDPGSAWSGASAATVDHVLRRACHVLGGDPLGDDAFDLDLEWRDRTIDYALGLGDPSCAQD